jgi:HEAT repeat protein
VVTGLLAPSVLLPPRAAEWDAERRRAVLLHELAHVQRGDCRVQALAQAACAMYWFNPLMWMTFARLRAERERACDDRVLMSGLMPSTYAGHLLEVARDLKNGLRPSAALAMARPSEFEGRLLAVLAERRCRVPSTGARAAAIVLVAAATAAALGASPSSAAAPDRPTASAPVESRFFVPLDGLAPEQRPAEHAARAEATRTLQSSTDWRERERAVLNLVASEGEPPIAPLAAALDDSSADVREKAALALALRSGSDVIPSLLKALTDSDAQVREKAALGLAMRRDQRATDALLAATADPDSQVREKVAMALATSGDARAAAALTQLRMDPDPQVREKAVSGLTLLEQGAGTPPDAESIRRGLRSMVGAIARLTR